MINFFLEFSDFLGIIGLVISILVLIFCDIKKVLVDKTLILYYYVLYLIIEASGNLLPRFLAQMKSNTWIYDNLPLFLCISLFFFFKSVHKTVYGQLFNKFGLAIIVIFYLATWPKSIDLPPNTEYFLLYAIFVVINSITYLLQELYDIQMESLFNNGQFWFIVSLLFYASTCTLLWMFYKEIYTKYPTNFNLEYLWSICHDSILFISCIFFSSAIYLKTRQSR